MQAVRVVRRWMSFQVLYWDSSFEAAYSLARLSRRVCGYRCMPILYLLPCVPYVCVPPVSFLRTTIATGAERLIGCTCDIRNKTNNTKPQEICYEIMRLSSNWITPVRSWRGLEVGDNISESAQHPLRRWRRRRGGGGGCHPHLTACSAARPASWAMVVGVAFANDLMTTSYPRDTGNAEKHEENKCAQHEQSQQ